jgi:hypothetical protein
MVHQPVAEDAQGAVVGPVGRIAQPVAQGALVAVLGQGLVDQAGSSSCTRQRGTRAMPMPAITARMMVWNWSNCGPAKGLMPWMPWASLQRAQASGMVTWRSRVQRATSWGVVMRASGPAPPGGAISATWRPTR